MRRQSKIKMMIMMMIINNNIKIYFEINISDKKSRRFDLSEVIFKCNI